jgi:hypothetical protein
MTDSSLPAKIAFTRAYIEKRADRTYNWDISPPDPPPPTMQKVVNDLCDATQSLLEENLALKDQLFQIEQDQSPDYQWETIIAAKLDRAIRENNGGSEASATLELTNHVNGETFVITIQKKHGKTPNQLFRQSEARRKLAVKKIVNLLRSNLDMQRKLSEVNEELRIAKCIRSHDNKTTKEHLDDALIEDEVFVQKAIDFVNILIKKFNNAKFRRGLNSLQPSMREAFHEAWTRVGESNYENIKLKEELKTLKIKMNEKNSSRGKFGKARKRRKR